MTIRAIILALALTVSAGAARADMFDHLVTDTSTSVLCGDLQPLGLCSFDGDGNPVWSPAVILNVGGANGQSIEVILSPAVWDKSDPDPRNWTITTPPVLAPGFWAIVSETHEDKALEALPNNVTMLVTDRDLAVNGTPPSGFIVYTGATFDPTWIGTVVVQPTPAGSNYPFGPQ